MYFWSSGNKCICISNAKVKLQIFKLCTVHTVIMSDAHPDIDNLGYLYLILKWIWWSEAFQCNRYTKKKSKITALFAMIQYMLCSFKYCLCSFFRCTQTIFPFSSLQTCHTVFLLVIIMTMLYHFEPRCYWAVRSSLGILSLYPPLLY